MKRALVVLGPQTHEGRRYQSLGVKDGLACSSLPLTTAGDFDDGQVVIQVTEGDA